MIDLWNKTNYRKQDSFNQLCFDTGQCSMNVIYNKTFYLWTENITFLHPDPNPNKLIESWNDWSKLF